MDREPKDYEPLVTLPAAIRLRHGTDEWTADVTIDVSHVPNDIRPVLVSIAYAHLYRSVSLTDEPPVMSWRPLVYPVLLVVATLAAAVFL